MTSWIVNTLDNQDIERARVEASRRLLNRAISADLKMEDDFNVRFIAEALDLAVLDLLDEEDVDELRTVSADAFLLHRVLPRPADPIDAAKEILRLACLGVLGDRTVDVGRFLKESPWSELPLTSQSWGERTLATILDIWLRLLRKDGWQDLNEVQQHVVSLRENQKNFEATYLEEKQLESSSKARTSAWELVALYHLSKAAELLAVYTTQGHIDGHFDIRQQAEAQFDRALTACSRAELIELHIATRLLARTAQQLIENSIWTVTRGVNYVSGFVEYLVNERSRPIFEVLPPQRLTLQEEGLLGSSHRSVVVSLPTSSGKTFIAQFRILQALNQFEREQGWVAYLAPTRALVNQICARLRQDFSSIGINVERVGPALEIDGPEASLLTDKTDKQLFRILVTTPEKLDLMIRGGWEAKIGRPLTLVVVDEAHNIKQKERGIKLELLLATINRECRYAQFLLLTPFIDNGDEIARWLDPDRHNDIQLQLHWQPNDIAVVLSKPSRGNVRGQFLLALETLYTSRSTLMVPEEISLACDRPLGLGWSDVKNGPGKLAAATAQILKERGPVIILSGTIPNAWGIAQTLKHKSNKITQLADDVSLVQRYLQEEFGENFSLSELLEYGIGVHHSGLSDEAKVLMEWLFEKEHIRVLVSTTTIAQGVNFPVSAVVLASHQYFYSEYPYSEDMPPEDFWNLAGRVGRVEQGSVGIVALASTDEDKAEKLREFVKWKVVSLNSTLITMVQEAMKTWGRLDLPSLSSKPEWSAFLQYLAHTYRLIGDPFDFASEVEQVLRGTLGFQNLRRTNGDWAAQLVMSVQSYGQKIAGKPLQLVDSTGFSWESVSATLARLSENRITEDVWDPARLFRGDNKDLQTLMGILLDVPELRDDLEAAIGGTRPDGDKLAHMVSDWVNGASLPEMATEYFALDKNNKAVDPTTALTNCCRNIFGKLTQTTSWGLAALQTMTFKDEFDRLPEDQQQTLRNLPARVFYGVNTDEAIALRLLGVPRRAAQPLANALYPEVRNTALPQLRSRLHQSNADLWTQALGKPGEDYFKVWRVLEGLA